MKLVDNQSLSDGVIKFAVNACTNQLGVQPVQKEEEETIKYVVRPFLSGVKF